jgi:hypothetical protein
MSEPPPRQSRFAGRNSLAQHAAAGGVLGRSEYRPESRRDDTGMPASDCTKMVYIDDSMATAKRAAAKQVRRSVTLPREIAKQVETMSKQRRLSDNRILVELIEQGIQARKEKEKAFFDLAKRFREASDPREVEQLGDQLGCFVFGE